MGLPSLKDLRERCTWHLGSGRRKDISSNSETDGDAVMDVRGAVEGLVIK
jgi:hypothetical protein